jgi:hypothetical protein
MSEISDVFKSLPGRFQPGAVKQPRTFYFSLGEDEKWTVALSPDKCEVKPGCFFKASEQMFLQVWNGKHTPGPKDFLTGSIKSNNPLMLREFVAAFKKA